MYVFITIGRTKAAGEAAVRQSGCRYVIIRPGLLLGPEPYIVGTRGCAVSWTVQCKSLKLFTDEYRTPVDVRDVAALIHHIVVHHKQHSHIVYNCGGPLSLSRFELGCMILEAAGRNITEITPVLQRDVSTGYPRPANVSLNSSVAHAIVNCTPLDKTIAWCLQQQ